MKRQFTQLLLPFLPPVLDTLSLKSSSPAEPPPRFAVAAAGNRLPMNNAKAAIIAKLIDFTILLFSAVVVLSYAGERLSTYSVWCTIFLSGKSVGVY